MPPTLTVMEHALQVSLDPKDCISLLHIKLGKENVADCFAL